MTNKQSTYTPVYLKEYQSTYSFLCIVDIRKPHICNHLRGDCDTCARFKEVSRDDHIFNQLRIDISRKDRYF